MTLDRAAGPGPRTVAHQASSPASRRRPDGAARRSSLAIAVALAVAIPIALAGCGAGPGPSGNAAPLTSLGPVPSASAPLGPSAGGSGGADASLGPGASGPRWPGTTVLATIALGAADGEIQKAGIDLQNAANQEDLKAMWGAADGLAKMIEGLTPNIARLEIYSETQAAAAIYRKAFPELLAGAKQLRDAITAGDASGIVAGSQQIEQGLADYSPVRALIAGLVEQAIVQQRLLLQ